MRAVTICQPYAELIARGEKTIENRTWPTHYRGPLLIHAGKSREWMEEGDAVDHPGMAFGAVVAMATLVDCRRWENLTIEQQKDIHANGPWCWMLADIRRLLRPVPWRGAQGLWLVERALESALADPAVVTSVGSISE